MNKALIIVVLSAGTAAAEMTWSEVAAAGTAAAERSAMDSGVVRGEAVAPVSVVTNAAGHLVYDFGRHVFGWVEVDVERPGAYELVWGELLDSSGAVQTNELYTRLQGRIRCARTKGEFNGTGWTRIPYVADGGSVFNTGDAGRFGKIMPFRWLEVVSAPFSVAPGNVRQVPIYYPYDMSESSFSSDSAPLERVYGFCKHSIRATTFMGMFVDGDRERLPYEGDSFITQLGTYAATSDDTLVRRTINHLSAHTTWPTEWKQFFIRMVYEDWMHSGKTDLVRKYYAMMKDVKSWRNLRRADGLLVTPGEKMTPSPDGGMFCDIVDWAKCYRDGFVFTPVNVVVNALHYRNLKELEAMARAIGEERDAVKFAAEAAQTFAAFQAAFFDSSAGRYRDGEGTDHATVQGNAMALACGVVPEENAGRVADYVASKGFSCSTYMAHFVLEALFAAGREDDAIRLMTSNAHRSWLGMMDKGATIAMEFWDLTMEERGRIPDMNHSWSTAPLNMISRRVLGVNPLKPGFEEISISPHPGPLKRLSGTVPTPQGPVRLKMERVGVRWNVEVETPKAAEFSFTGRVMRLVAGRHSFVVPAAAAAFAANGATIVVVVPDAPTAVERFAAAELAGELGKCLGEKPEIVREGCAPTSPCLFVGATKAAKVARNAAVSSKPPYLTDEVFLKSVNGGVVLDGDSARAPIYAVDLYLEKYCGVRWWTSDTAFYPKLGGRTSPSAAAREDTRPPVPLTNIDYQYAPQFKYRETYYLDGFDPMFKVRSKGNFTSLTRYLLSELKFVPPEMGGNHRLYFFEGRRSAYHSFFEILPPKVYFDAHPEWYSLVNGKREAKQLCLANDEMRSEYIRETLRRLREDPTADFISVSQNDWNGFCECEKCTAMMAEDGGAASGPYIRFANDVAEAVEKEFPNVRIDTFAYTFTRKAPTKTRPRHNVVVRLCDIECDFARPLADASAAKNAGFAKDLAEWRRIAGGNLFIWDYLANFTSYMMPHPNISQIAPNIRLFAENGAVGVFEQGDALCSAGSFAALRHYLAAHLLWNPADDEKLLVDEFLAGYYGKAAAPILKKFIAVVEDGPRKTKKSVRCYHRGAEFLTGDDQLEAARLMDEAVAAAAKEGGQLAVRVRRERLSVDHMMILDYDALKALAAKKGIPWTRPAMRAEAVEDWIRDVKAFGVKAVHETTRSDDMAKYFSKVK